MPPHPHRQGVPLATAALPGTGGVLEDRFEDFAVEERLLSVPAGEGEHLWVRVQKRGLSTERAADLLARAAGVPAREVGWAGRKDARAVTVQTLSLPPGRRADPALGPLHGRERGLTVLDARAHPKKLRLGQLAGNRFRLRLRGDAVHRAERARRVLEALARDGMPNAFGPQRYGHRGDGARIGAAVLEGDAAGALSAILGEAGPRDTGRWREARELFDRGEIGAAARAWPGAAREERALARELARSGDPERALAALSKRRRALYVAARQSEVFDALLAARLERGEALLPGDWIVEEASGAHRPADPDADPARVRAFEVSPTAPLFGRKVGRSDGEAGRVEDAVLASLGATLEAFARGPASGARRPLRVRLTEPRVDVGTDEAGAFLELAFALPPGAYATTVLREVQEPAGAPGELAGDARRQG